MVAVEDSSAVVTSNERLVEAFLTAFVGGDTEAIADLVTDDCVLHQPRWPLDTEGKEAIIEATRTNEGTFTDLDITVERSVLAGDELAAYVTASGRNVGPVRMENREVAPTGLTFEVPQFGHYRIENDHIAEAWILEMHLGLSNNSTTFRRARVNFSRLPCDSSGGDSTGASASTESRVVWAPHSRLVIGRSMKRSPDVIHTIRLEQMTRRADPISVFSVAPETCHRLRVRQGHAVD